MEMQKSLGEINASIKSLSSAIDSIKSKVDDLTNWKNRILGGALVLGAVITVLGFLVGKFWDHVTFKSPVVQTIQQSQATTPSIPEIPIATPTTTPKIKPSP